MPSESTSGDGSSGPGTGVPAPHASPRLVAVVAAGGAVGAPLRYAVSRLLPSAPGHWPTATFVTNVAGSFLLGMLLEGLARRGPDAGRRQVLRLALGTGVLGAFTTYSTLAAEVVLLGRGGGTGLALAYGLTSAVAGALAEAAGIALSALTSPDARRRSG